MLITSHTHQMTAAKTMRYLVNHYEVSEKMPRAHIISHLFLPLVCLQCCVYFSVIPWIAHAIPEPFCRWVNVGIALGGLWLLFHCLDKYATKMHERNDEISSMQFSLLVAARRDRVITEAEYTSMLRQLCINENYLRVIEQRKT